MPHRSASLFFSFSPFPLSLALSLRSLHRAPRLAMRAGVLRQTFTRNPKPETQPLVLRGSGQRSNVHKHVWPVFADPPITTRCCGAANPDIWNTRLVFVTRDSNADLRSCGKFPRRPDMPLGFFKSRFGAVSQSQRMRSYEPRSNMIFLGAKSVFSVEQTFLGDPWCFGEG